MKSIFCILLSAAMLMCAFNSKAQATLTPSSSTNTGAVTQTHTINLGGETFNYDILTFQLIGTKVSGTPGGTAILYGSIDGTNYDAIGADTLTIANVTTNSKIWKISKTYYKYYKVNVNTTGTQVSTWATYMLGRKIPR